MPTLRALICCLFLSACATEKTVFIEKQRATTEIVLPEPLHLRSVAFRVDNSEDNVYYILDNISYENLVKNTEDVQNRLYYYHNVISKQQNFIDGK